MVERVAQHVTEYLYTNGNIERFRKLIDDVAVSSADVSSNQTTLLNIAEEQLGRYNVNPHFFRSNDNAIGLLLAAGLHSSMQLSRANRTPRHNLIASSQTISREPYLAHIPQLTP